MSRSVLLSVLAVSATLGLLEVSPTRAAECSADCNCPFEFWAFEDACIIFGNSNTIVACLDGICGQRTAECCLIDLTGGDFCERPFCPLFLPFPRLGIDSGSRDAVDSLATCGSTTEAEDWAILSYLTDASGLPSDARIEDTSYAPYAERELAALAAEPSARMEPARRERVLRAHGFVPETIPETRGTSPRNFILTYDPPRGARPLRSFEARFRTLEAPGVPEGRYYLRLAMGADAAPRQIDLLGPWDLSLEVADFVADNLSIVPTGSLPDAWVLILSLRIAGGEAAAIVSAFGVDGSAPDAPAVCN